MVIYQFPSYCLPEFSFLLLLPRIKQTMSHEIKERRSSIDETAQIFTDGNLIPPDNLSDVREKALEFVRQESKEGRPVVLVTSGGTTVPLEHNTVRFVDNFSAGTRGSSSTEYDRINCKS